MGSGSASEKTALPKRKRAIDNQLLEDVLTVPSAS
jgi:hypothetical protein